MFECPRLIIRLAKSPDIEEKAPATHSICIICALFNHFSVSRITINSLDTKARPNIAGKLIKAAKRINFRNTFF